MGRTPFDEPPLRTPPPVRRVNFPSRTPKDPAAHDGDEGFDLLGEDGADPNTVPYADVVSTEESELFSVSEFLDDETTSATPAIPGRELTPERRVSETPPLPPLRAVSPPAPAEVAPPARRPAPVPVLATPPLALPKDDPDEPEVEEQDGVVALRGTAPLVCQLTLLIAQEAVPCESGAILLEADSRLLFVAGSGPHGSQWVGRVTGTAVGVAGFTFQSGRPLASNDVRQLPWHAGEGTDGQPEIRGMAAVPIRGGGRVRGVLQLINRGNGQSAFDQVDVETLASIASVLGEQLRWQSLASELAPVVAAALRRAGG